MSTQITTAFVNQYSAVAKQVVQQMESKFRPRVNIESLKGEKGFFDFIGKVTWQQKTTRHSKVSFSDTPHTRRMIVGAEWYWSDLVDKGDETELLLDPTSKYLEAARMSGERKIDSLIMTAALATAYTGKEGTGTETWPTTGSSGTSMRIATGSVGMTVSKLISALELFNLNDVPTEWEKWCAIAPQQVSDLLQETEVGSADYNMLRPLVEGEITRFMGFNFIMSNQLYKSSTTRSCVAWVPQGITLAINRDVQTRVSEMPEYHYATMPYMSMFMGASRMDADCVVEIQCTEA